MAADRFFFGIPALANFQASVMRCVPSDKDTFLVGYEFNCDHVDGSDFTIVGQDAHDATKYPTASFPNILDEKAMVTVGAGAGTVRSHENFCFKLEAGSRIAVIASPNASTDLVSARYTLCELLQKASAVKERLVEDVLRSMKPSNIFTYGGYMNVAAAGPFWLEHMVADKKIQQPATAVAVADELNVVSTSASDDGDPAGVGARTVQFKYLDASLVSHSSAAITLNGTTPVDIIGTYADVYIITEAWVATKGAAGFNLGDIVFQDDA